MFFGKKKQPFHNGGRLNSVAIITDGNGRWATRRGLPRSSGHVEGAKRIEPVLEKFKELGVHHVTFYAFSTENWKRPADEVETIMKLVYKYVDEVVIDRIKRDGNFSVRFIGDLSPLSAELREKCLEAENMARDKEFVCNIALNYGGRDEIVNAVNRVIADGNTRVDEKLLSSYMYTSASPDPDLVIRTGGNLRISNFLLWQSAYSEYVFLDTLWPDFGEREIMYAVNEFMSRKRRFGGLDSKNEGDKQ